MKTRTQILLISLFFLAGLFLGLFLNSFLPSLTGITGKAIAPIENNLSNYTYTTALCNYETKECIDVKVICESGSPTEITPISSLVEFTDDWNDPRKNNQKLCE